VGIFDNCALCEGLIVVDGGLDGRYNGRKSKVRIDIIVLYFWEVHNYAALDF